MRGLLPGFVISIASAQAQTVDIKLLANESLATTIGYDDAMYFQPYYPTPLEPMECADECPCFIPGIPICDCGVEMVCSGTTPIDLSSGDKLSFQWDASSVGEKYISIQGNRRTRVEFQAKVENCEAPFQDIFGSDISFEFDDAGLDVGSQRYTYSTDDSFITLGTCDDGSCGRVCELYTRLQFDPDAEGVLELKFKSLTYYANYDPQMVDKGAREYQWGTNFYMWIRQPENGVIEFLDAPAITTTTTLPAPTTSSEDVQATTAATTTGSTSTPETTTSSGTTPAAAENDVLKTEAPTTSPTKLSDGSGGYPAKMTCFTMAMLVLSWNLLLPEFEG